MNERRRLIFMLFAIVALFTAAWLAVRRGTAFDPVRDHSSERRNPWGTAAWRELIERSGVATAAWEHPFTALDDGVEVLVVLSPLRPLSKQETEALLDWVRRGGRVILAPSAYRPSGFMTASWGNQSMLPLLHGLGVERVSGWARSAAVPVVATEELTADVRSVWVPSEYRLALRPELRREAVEDATVLLADEDGAAALDVPLGRGHVIILCEAEMLANATLPRADNVVFAANLVFAGGAPAVVHFNEYRRSRRGTADVFGDEQVDPRPLQYTGLALLAVAVVFALGRAKRFGAPVRRTDTQWQGAADQVRAFASIYARAHAGEVAARMLAAGLRSRLARYLGIPVTAPELILRAALERRGLPATEITDLLTRLETAGERIADRQLLAWAQEVAKYERMLV